MNDYLVRTTIEDFIVEADTFRSAFHTAYEILAEKDRSAKIISITDIKLSKEYS